MKKGKQLAYILIIFFIGLLFFVINKKENACNCGKEGFSDYKLSDAGSYPKIVDTPILDTFRHTGHKYASNDNSSGIWWYYPSFGVGSFKQLTNNLRYRNNPDEGTCSRADMCGALYRRKKNKSNIILPLPEAEEGPGARVGYFRATPNELVFSIPTNENILY